ncbi:pyridoxal phosphate-dependent aminotransferase [Sulfitobacter pseudonitzschiae]|uniref:cysteine-S-conjugate beta-lyase n=1 Tax=Pseudosulfitobacter pseudonitzschiae TaxID=1402135 RepID=A0A9Q2NKZ3_9RHOB|nr:MalY/PatB family protein [Pseudosulfitobacter pseudonitzschiae]MBM2292618.1 pyridoxal phosphate-dependent aminotransferase [Pseudosulfitobacter pseudonitzschiae]MBM2297535.1 pyridoxal phosphate-dependent aminotransferase [Pseudosulfitobacter pseudonitzschiae]MBM2302449.1 pyridoxal phosphate-dependent aminotransferase [Pseudosulfitobacter pseudonitzschiae]MBM2312232.1 pyridoxal phosphate-dependent aminotransferase [Pseudosulfitobacter pseudonitzschiae]MBM2317145.1 pyridoxal phosphate-depende
MSFDDIVDRRGTHCAKWDMMDKLYGVSADDGLAMWVADMDFAPPQCVLDALQARVDHGMFGYFGDDSEYHAAIQWWMKERHGWDIQPEWIFTTHGLVNGAAMCIDAYTQPGDGVVMFTPIYHAFARVINAADRRVVECQMALNDGRYELDFDAWDAQLDGSEKLLLLCSPHNPGGRVWTKAELEGVAAFAKRHDLIIVSDEIHHDLVMPGNTHIPMAKIEGVTDRLVMMSATTKTFSIAGAHVGNVIIQDETLRVKFAKRMGALGLSPNAFGLFMATAAYSPEGAKWVDDVMEYIAGNARIFDAGVNAIPGLKAMPLQATYLSWVDFAGTGMSREEVTRRIEKDAQIAANYGPTFGKGGETFMRFNIATQRSRVEDAVARLTKAFSDLQ